MSGHSKNVLRFYLSFLVWMLCAFLLRFSLITQHPVEGFRNKDDHCLAVFLDIAATFDTIKPHHIKEQLLPKGVEENIVS